MNVLENTIESMRGVRWESQNAIRVLAECYQIVGGIRWGC